MPPSPAGSAPVKHRNRQFRCGVHRERMGLWPAFTGLTACSSPPRWTTEDCSPVIYHPGLRRTRVLRRCRHYRSGLMVMIAAAVAEVVVVIVIRIVTMSIGHGVLTAAVVDGGGDVVAVKRKYAYMPSLKHVDALLQWTKSGSK